MLSSKTKISDAVILIERSDGRIPRRDFARALREMLHDVQHDTRRFGQLLYYLHKKSPLQILQGVSFLINALSRIYIVAIQPILTALRWCYIYSLQLRQSN